MARHPVLKDDDVERLLKPCFSQIIIMRDRNPEKFILKEVGIYEEKFIGSNGMLSIYGIHLQL
jgi:hypothetical protein